MRINKLNYIAFVTVPFIFLLLLMIWTKSFALKLTIYTLDYIFLVSTFLKSKKNNLLSIPFLFTVYHVVYIGLCPFFLCMQNILVANTTGLINSIVGQKEFYNQQCFLILISYYAFLIATTVFKTTRRNAYDATNIIQLSDKKIPYSKQIALIMFVVSFLCEAVYLLKNWSILFGGQLESGRIDAMAGNGILLYGMWLGTFGLAMLYELVHRNRFKAYYFWILCMTHVVTIALIGFRSRLIVLALFLVLIYNRYKKIEQKKLIALGGILLLAVSSLSVLRGVLSGESAVSMLDSVVISLGNGSINMYYVLRQFPDRTPFQYGYTFLINFIMLAPGSQPDFTIWLKNQIGIVFSGGGVTPTLLGEAWMNFGTIGVLIEFFITGLICNHLDRKYYSTKNIYFIVLNIWVLTSSVRGGFSNSLINLIIYSLINGGLYILFTNGSRKDRRFI